MCWILARINLSFDQKNLIQVLKLKMGKKLRLIFCQNISLKEFSIKPDKNFTKTYIVHVITSYLLQPCTPTNVKSTLSISRVSFVYSVSCSMHLKRTYEYRSPILQSNLIIADVFNFYHNDLKTFEIKFVDKTKYVIVWK